MLVLAVLSQIVHAKNTSGLSAQLRFGSTTTEDATGRQVWTQTLGGYLGYISPVHKGFRAGAKLYTTNPVGANDDGFFLSSRNKGYNIIGDAWLQADFAKTQIRLGRQELDTPLINTDDIGMIPDTAQGIVINNNSLANTTVTTAHLEKWAGVDSARPEQFTPMNGSHGVQLLGVVYKKKNWGAQFWQYWQKNATDLSYAEFNSHAIDGLDLGLQYTVQKGHAASGTGKAWGATASYEINKFSFRADYNKVSGASGVTNGFGGGPYFTSGEINTIDGVANITAKALGIEYTGIDQLTLGLRKVNFDRSVGDELDATLSYKFRDNLSADLIYSDLGSDGKNTRFFVNYDVDF